MSTALSCSGCGAAGAEVEHGNPGPGELCAGPGMASQHGSLYCADCLACIPRPPETRVNVSVTVRDAAVLLARLDGIHTCGFGDSSCPSHCLDQSSNLINSHFPCNHLIIPKTRNGRRTGRPTFSQQKMSSHTAETGGKLNRQFCAVVVQGVG